MKAAPLSLRRGHIEEELSPRKRIELYECGVGCMHLLGLSSWDSTPRTEAQIESAGSSHSLMLPKAQELRAELVQQVVAVGEADGILQLALSAES